ncbi:hypothetical protein O5O45_14210 [Hahella aquimaris]|uniref:hypothetical protein n=1 Tax=Hahella sp. HNIBRBA332 TaxID=3015983 RepID=UPI00273C3B09|nr:hypothetical protein [Hahella sp. HNIBRBA332]WLQ17070.1 hypothetical protein O5O45_14210 [Hahella sp. HNIBRBA332]
MSLLSYKKSIKISVVAISVLSILFLLPGILHGNIYKSAFWGGILLSWWGVYYLLKSDKKASFWASLLLVFVFWIPLFWRTYERVKFIIDNGGMERADGYGSPMAFLIGLVTEQFFFIPLTLSAVLGVIVAVEVVKSKVGK